MKTFYRGVRLPDYQAEGIKKHGMKYYWGNTEDCVKDIFRCLEKHKKISQLGRNPILRSLVIEGSRLHRLQLWGTESKANAESYARATPELIFLTLDYAGVERPKNIKYLNERYGKPYVVTFQVDDDRQGINEICGQFITAKHIISVEPVDVTGPDPYFQKLEAEVM